MNSTDVTLFSMYRLYLSHHCCHFLDADKVPSPAEDVMAAQQKPKPTHAIEEPLPPPPPSPQSTASQSMAPSPPPPQAAEQMKSGSGKVLATPAVRKIAMEHNVSGIICMYFKHFILFPFTKLTIHSFCISDTKPTHWLSLISLPRQSSNLNFGFMCSLFQITLGDVSGTGKDGRILKEDIMNYIEKMKSAPTAGKYAITMSSGLNLMWIGSPAIQHFIHYQC